MARELIIVLLSTHLAVGWNVQLTKLDTVYLPYDFQNGQPQYSLLKGALEESVYEPTGKLIYAAGTGIIHVLDASDPARLVYLNRIMHKDLEFTDVETCEGHVYLTYLNQSDPLNGGVLLYRAYSRESGTMELIRNIPVGAYPDMLAATPNCTIVVAIENEAVEVGGQLIDPPGGVGIIRFPQGIANTPEIVNLDFQKFNDRFEELSASGVRWVYRGQSGSSNPFSNNVEPEYITFNTDYTKAYIALQETNAIAVVDLANNNITAIHGLGFKEWGQLDPSDMDGGVNIAIWPVYGMYQPDNIHFVRWSGEDYIITANEGDSQEYRIVNFSERKRGSEFLDSEIASTVNVSLKQALKDDAKLGRLFFSAVDGRNSEGKFEKFYTYGARSFSVFRASDMQRVYDSGSEIERKIADLRPDIFNANLELEGSPRDSVDTRSDDKGPETETVATGELDGRLLIFVGNERSQTLFVYSVEQGSMSPVFQTMVSGVPRDGNRTWVQLYEDRDLYGGDLQSIEFHGPGVMADYPVLLTSGAVTGTITTYKVEVIDSSTDTRSGNISSQTRTGSVWIISAALFCVCSMLRT